MANNALFFNTDQEALREMYFKAWQKFQLKETLEPLEKQIVNLIQSHTEYLEYFENAEKYRNYMFSSENNETNPFLHLGLHITLLEQISTNRPKGITAIYHELTLRLGDPHHTEHHMMEILANQLFDLMNKQRFFDEKNYVKQLKKLLKKGCTHHH